MKKRSQTKTNTKKKKNNHDASRAQSEQSKQQRNQETLLGKYYKQIQDEAMAENQNQNQGQDGSQFRAALQAQIACATGKSNAALDILASPTSNSFGLDSVTCTSQEDHSTGSYAGDDEETHDITAANIAATTKEALASLQEQMQQNQQSISLAQDSIEDSVIVETVQSDASGPKNGGIVDVGTGSNLEEEPFMVETPVPALATSNGTTTKPVAAVDFANVQLKHLASKSGEDDDSVKTGPQLPTIEHAMSHPTIGTSTAAETKGAETTDALYHVMSEGAGTTQARSTGQANISNKLFANFRKLAAEGSASPPPPPQVPINPLVASLQKSMSFNSNSNNNSPTSVSTRISPADHRKQALEGDYLQQQQSLQQPSMETAGANTQFDFVNMDVNAGPSNVSASGDVNVVYANIDKVVSEASSTGAGSYQPPSNSNYYNNTSSNARYTMNSISPPVSPSRRDKEVTFSDTEEVDSRGKRYQRYQRPLPSYPTSDDDDDEDHTNTNYESDDSHRWRRSDKQQRLLRSSSSGIVDNMTLMQTMKHNTRANFCAIFLLGVALATLILLVVAKLTSNRERLFYDEDKGANVVITDNERLLTLEVLAFALILVLLMGSMLYCGVACCDTSSQELVKQVKHEDACLANSTGRRTHPHERPAYSNKWYNKGSPKRGGGIVLTPPNCDDHSHSHNSDARSHTDDNYLQNPTFSLMSSATEQSQDAIDMESGAVVLSMEEEEHSGYYDELENQAGCCSPLSLPINSTDHDEDDIESMKRNMLV